MNSIELAILEIKKYINKHNQLDEDIVSVIADKFLLSTIDFSNLCEKLSSEGIQIASKKELKSEKSIEHNENPIELIKSIYQKLSVSEKCKCLSELALLIDDKNHTQNYVPDVKAPPTKHNVTDTDIPIQDNWLKYVFTSKNDLSFTTPVLLRFKENTIKSNKWTDMFIRFITLLYNDSDYRNLLIEMAESSSSILVNSSKASKLRRARQIANNIYVETNRNSTEKVEVIKALVDYCDISYKDIELYYVKDR